MSELEVMKVIRELSAEVNMLRAELRLMKMQQSGNRKKLTMKEACEYLRIGRTTMQNRIMTGEITFAVKVGKSWLFDVAKLEQYASGMG